MPKLPSIPARKLLKVLKKAGYAHDRTEGSHFIFFRAVDKRTVSVPVHKGRDLGKGLLASLLKDADISPEDFMRLLK